MAQKAAIGIARELGLQTILFDRSSLAPACSSADQVFQVGVEDVRGVLRIISEVAENFNIRTCSGVADYAFETIGEIYDTLGICQASARETYARLGNKAACRSLLSKNDINVPVGLIIDSSDDLCATCERIRENLRFPVVLKSALGHGSLGVRTIWTNGSELDDAIAIFQQTSDGGVVEEKVVGRHFNIDGLVVDGQFHPVLISERFFVDDETHQCELSIHPADIAEADATRLFDLATNVACVSRLENGPVTLDAVQHDTGEVFVIEVSPHFHNLTSTVSVDGGACLRAWFNQAVGNHDRMSGFRHRADGVTGLLRLYAPGDGFISEVCGLDFLTADPCIITFLMNKKAHDQVRIHNEHRDLCGLIWFRAPDHGALQETMKNIRHQVRVRLKPTPPESIENTEKRSIH